MHFAHADFVAMFYALIANVVVAAASLGAGLFVRPYLPASMGRIEKISFAWLAGFGLLSLTLFLAGLHSFTRPVIFAVLLLYLIALAIRFRSILMRPGISIEAVHGALIPICVIGLVLALTFIAGLAAPSGDWGNDAIAYHLVGPKVWLRDAVIHPVLDNSHTAFPATVEVVYAALMSIGGPTAVCCSAVWTFGLFLAVAFFLARRCGLSQNSAIWAAALTASMPAVYSGAHTAFVDVIYAAFLLGALRVFWDADSYSLFACAGLFCGFTIATKYTGLLAVPLLVICSAVYGVLRAERQDSERRETQLVIAATVAVLFGMPFYIRNWLVLGSPVYPPTPFLARFFHSRYFPPEAILSFREYIVVRGAGLGRGFGAFMLLPFNLTFHTSNFHGAGGIGLAPLALAPFALWASRRDPLWRASSIFALCFTIAWHLTQQESRFLIPIYALASVAAVAGWRVLNELRSRTTAILCWLVVGISLSYGLFMIVSSRLSDIHSALSSSYAFSRSHAEVPYLAAFDFLNRDSSVRSVLILDRSVAPYYSDKPYVKVIGQWGELPIPAISSTAEALDRLKELGVTHILDVESGLGGFQVQQDPRWALAFAGPHQRVYRVQ